MATPLIIKRYTNRKMYDTARSCYVTLEEVAQMVRDGHEVQVIDNKTKEDLTQVTLTQALLDSERRNRGTVPLSGLRNLIESGNEFLARKVTEPVNRAREGAVHSIANWKDEAGKTIHALKTEAEKRADRVLHRQGADGGESADAHGQKLANIVEQTTKAVDELQHRVDEGVRQALAAWMHRDANEVVVLRQRVESLEARLAVLETRRGE